MQISLRELQLWLKWIVVDPRGVTNALQTPHPKNSLHPDRYMAPHKSAYHLIEAHHANIEERLSVYAEGYFSRIVEVLETDFCATKKLLGEENFLKLVAEYLKNHPSYNENITEIGRYLPDYAKKTSFQTQYPYFADLILLEWKVLESFYANDMPPFDVNVLSQFSEEQIASSKIIFDPSIHLIQSNWPIHLFWQKRYAKDFVLLQKNIQQKNTYLCVHRIDDDIHVIKLASKEFNALQILQKGASIGELMETLAVRDADKVRIWFAKWMQNHMIRGLR